MDEWNRPAPVCRRLTLTLVVRSKPIATGLIGNGHGYKNMGPECILTILHVPTVIRSLGDTRLGRIIKLSGRPEMEQLFTMFWPSIPFLQVALAV